MKKMQAEVAAFCFAVVLAFILSTPAVEVQAQSELPDVGCAREDRLRSTDGSTSTKVTFVNHSALTVRTYWLNYQGKRVFYAEVAPGSSYEQQTYVTHPWVITNSRSGDCVAIYLPTRSPGIVAIR